MKARTFELVYLLIVLADLYAMYQYPGLRLITKPLIVSSLLIWYINGAGERQSPVILTAMIFALVGDIFLLFDGALFFQLGIAGFLLMQLCYISYFKRWYQKPTGIKVFLSAAVVLIALIFNLVFYDKLGEYKIPVMIYSVAIATMVWFGVNQKLSAFVVTGALLFLISDLTLAYQKFVNKVPIFDLVVMVTYVLAQYQIIKRVRRVNG